MARLRPGVDGLILEYGSHRATFLPQVWEVIAEPGLRKVMTASMRETVRVARRLGIHNVVPDVWGTEISGPASSSKPPARILPELAAAFVPSRERQLETSTQGRAFIDISRAAWSCEERAVSRSLSPAWLIVISR